jgi:hypothetical protein
MEFVRFGGTIPGEYWGCCCVDIIQNFHQDPDTPASIQLVEGDGGSPLTKGNEFAFLGPTLRDIFWQRLRISTFGLDNQPNKAFLAVFEESQLSSSCGSKWLAILKEAGFEFIRAIDNAVYTGSKLDGKLSPHPNYLFGLFRNIGGARIEDPFTPPKQWTELTTNGKTELWEFIRDIEFKETLSRKALGTEHRNADRVIWDEHGPTNIMSESEVVAAGAPVIMAGLRTMFPPQNKADREARMKAFPDYGPSEGTQSLYD